LIEDDHENEIHYKNIFIICCTIAIICGCTAITAFLLKMNLQLSQYSPQKLIAQIRGQALTLLLSIASAVFESNISRTDTVDISKNVRIQFHNNYGEIVFK